LYATSGGAASASDSQLVVKNPAAHEHHARASIPYGPWDVESGVQFVELDIPSESELDMPQNYTVHA
jgi:hypothetical protein